MCGAMRSKQGIHGLWSSSNRNPLIIILWFDLLNLYFTLLYCHMMVECGHIGRLETIGECMMFSHLKLVTSRLNGVILLGSSEKEMGAPEHPTENHHFSDWNFHLRSIPHFQKNLNESQYDEHWYHPKLRYRLSQLGTSQSTTRWLVGTYDVTTSHHQWGQTTEFLGDWAKLPTNPIVNVVGMMNQMMFRENPIKKGR